MNRFLGVRIGAWVLGAILVASAPCVEAQLSYRPGQEHRSLNTDQYQISIQKNGLLDVVARGGRPVFLNVFPMVRFEGKKGLEELEIDGRYSQRYEVNGPLGRGNGMLLKQKDCEWSVQAYPTQPFIAVHVTYVNTTKKPVSVSQLMPWCVGDPRKGAFTLGPGAGATPILVDTLGGGDARLTFGATESDTHLAVHNTATGYSLIAGFLTQERALTTVSIGAPAAKDDDGYESFRAVCTYDPPVVVEPGGRLESEVFYLAVAERDVLEGLERYARALAVANEVDPRESAVAHGWEVTGDALDEATILDELDFMEANLAPFGWRHVSIGRGWQRAVGDWEADGSRFPNGMGALVAEIHRRGMTAGLWVDPFVADGNSALAREHPDWFLNSVGRDGLRVLDVSKAGAVQFVEQLGRRVRDWDFDVVTGVDTQVLLDTASDYAGPQTRVELARDAIGAWMGGLGPGRVVVGATPSILSGAFFQSMELPSAAGASASSSIRGAARRYYFGSHLWSPMPQWPRGDGANVSGREMTRMFTAMSMMGGSDRFRQRPSRLQPGQIEIMRRVLPTPRRPARVLDLFYADDPRVWVMPIDSPLGRWNVAAVFNWDTAKSTTVTLPFTALGLPQEYYFTVYDFWSDRYYGTARGKVDVDVEAGGVRVLGLKRYRNRPMLLGSESHFLQGALSLNALEWDSISRRLSGSFEAVAGSEHGLRFLVPEGYEAREIEASAPGEPMVMDGRVLKLKLMPSASGPVDWSIQF